MSSDHTIKRCDALTIHSFPNELLAEFFLATIRAEYTQYLDVPSDRYAPWNLAAVCKQWRQICLSTPLLWTKITSMRHVCNLWTETTSHGYVYKHKRSPCKNNLDFRRCTLQLGRSGSQLLDVDCFTGVVQTSKYSDYTECQWRTIVNSTAAAQVSRWRSLRYANTRSNVWNTFSGLFPSDCTFDALEALQYHCRTDDIDFIDNPSEDDDCFRLKFPTRIGPGTLPRLHRLYLSDWNGHMDIQGFPWTSLRVVHLTAFRGTRAALLTSLSECPNLINFRLGGDTRWETDALGCGDRPPVELPRLRQLDLSYCEWFPDMHEVLAPLLLWLHAPLLETFITDAILNPSDLDILKEFIARTGCKIKNFYHIVTWSRVIRARVIRRDSAFDLDITTLLPSLPHLEELTLQLTGRTSTTQSTSNCNSLLSALAFDDGRAEPLVPRLRHLALLEMSFDSEPLMHLIKNRKPGSALVQGRVISPLKRVEIGVPKGYKREATRQVKSMQRDLPDFNGLLIIQNAGVYEPASRLKPFFEPRYSSYP